MIIRMSKSKERDLFQKREICVKRERPVFICIYIYIYIYVSRKRETCVCTINLVVFGNDRHITTGVFKKKKSFSALRDAGCQFIYLYMYTSKCVWEGGHRYTWKYVPKYMWVGIYIHTCVAYVCTPYMYTYVYLEVHQYVYIYVYLT